MRALPLWLAYIFWDFLFVLAATTVATIILQAVSQVWFGLGYLFVVLTLYGLTSTLGAYVVSLFAKSQVCFLSYVIGGLSLTAFSFPLSLSPLELPP